MWWVYHAGGAHKGCDARLKMNGGLACSKLTYGAVTAASNTAVVSTVQPATSLVGRAADCTAAAGTQVLPYTVKMPPAQAYANNDVTKNGGLLRIR